MMLAPGCSDPAAVRLVASLARLTDPAVTWVLTSGADEPSGAGLRDHLHRAPAGARLLVLSAVGTHPDARSPRLRRLWAIEELARGAHRPVLVLRLGALIGPMSPLWLRLEAGVPEGARELIVAPLDEADALEAIARALDGRVAWEGWFDLVGPEPMTLAELAEIAVAHRSAVAPPPQGRRGAWEPALEELAEHGLRDPEPWILHFGVRPGRIGERVAQWA